MFLMCSSGCRENKEEGVKEVEEGEEQEGEVDSIWKELKLLGELPLSSGNFDPEG